MALVALTGQGRPMMAALAWALPGAILAAMVRALVSGCFIGSDLGFPARQLLALPAFVLAVAVPSPPAPERVRTMN